MWLHTLHPFKAGPASSRSTTPAKENKVHSREVHVHRRPSKCSKCPTKCFASFSETRKGCEMKLCFTTRAHAKKIWRRGMKMLHVVRHIVWVTTPTSRWQCYSPRRLWHKMKCRTLIRVWGLSLLDKTKFYPVFKTSDAPHDNWASPNRLAETGIEHRRCVWTTSYKCI